MGTIQLGIAAALFQAVAFALYNKGIICGQIRPNASTWGVWTFLAALNLVTYGVSSGSGLTFIELASKTALPAVSTVGTFVTFLYSLCAGKFTRLDRTERALAAVGVVAGGLWWFLERYLEGALAAGYTNVFIRPVLKQSI